MTRCRRPTRTQTLIVAVILSALSALPAAGAGERVVAVGDIHGNFDGFVSILKRAELIDDDLHWVGGSTTFVQTGDIFDRGVEVRKVLDLLMRLEKEAAGDGGKVIVLLGNHEGMNLIGFYRDVNPEVFATFADENSEKRRKKEFKDFKKYWRAQAKAMGVENPVITAEIKNTWMEAFPPGWFEQNDALGPDGHYGAWLRQRPVAVMVGDTLFIHGGVGPDLAGLSVAEINQEVANELATYDRLRAEMVAERLVPASAGLNSLMEAYARQDPPDPRFSALAGANAWLIRSSGGPLWFRGSARWDEEVDAARMAELLDGIGASRVVSGHTVQDEGRIEVRFGGRIILIDTGMLSSVYQGGRASALVIKDGIFSAIYTDGSEEFLLDEALPEAA
jgi:hypothetical protein